MTHITDGRVIGNHADMGRARRKATGAAQSTWDSEGGATQREATDGQGGSAPGGAEGLPQTPTRLDH
jgi:hypothetical protein